MNLLEIYARELDATTADKGRHTRRDTDINVLPALAWLACGGEGGVSGVANCIFT